MQVRKVTLVFNEVARTAGFSPGPDGRLQLPATQETYNTFQRAAAEMFLPWAPGDDYLEVTLTGAGPVWAYMAIQHGLHGVARTLIYAAPNCEPMKIWHHGGAEKKS